MRWLLVSLFSLLALLTPALAEQGTVGVTLATVYVYSPPTVHTQVRPVDGGLQCSWTITDRDPGDSFLSELAWLKDGQDSGLADQADICPTHVTCVSEVLAPIRAGESWTCSIKVTDSYGAVGESSATYSPAPLAFLRGFVEVLSRAACSLLNFC